MKIQNLISKIYDELLEEDFLTLSPEEKLATCNNCYKLRSHAPLPKFNPQTKCCTFYPFIPNFLVGAILEDQATVLAAEFVRQAVKERSFVLPIGLCAPEFYQVHFLNKRQEDFGRNAEFRCPFYEVNKGTCGVWPYRGSECVSYHCVSSYGDKGERFWSGVSAYLHHAELELAQLVMIEKGYTPSEIDKNLYYVRIETEERRRQNLDINDWNSLWIHHVDDIESYYKDSFKFVTQNKEKLKSEINVSRRSTEVPDPKILKSLIMG